MSRAQGSLEYVIIIGGVIILAAATYFMLRGFSQTTGAGTTEQIGIAGEKFQLEIENLGRAETRFRTRKWANPLLQKRTLMEFSSLGDVTFNATNLTDHGLQVSSLEFYFFDGSFHDLNYTVAGEILTVHTGSACCATDFDLYIFYNNFTALINPCLANYTGPPRVSCGTVPLPDPNPPSINISSSAYGLAGSVVDAEINVTVNGTGSNVSEVYYRIDDSVWFPADNLYYNQGGITAEAHPVDGKYNDEFETIQIIATVPAEDNYTVSVLARDEYGNEEIEEENVSITIMGGITSGLLIYFSGGDDEANVSFLDSSGNDSLKIELPLGATVTSASMNVTGLDMKSDFNFSPRVDYSLGTAPWPIVAGDFNNDGNLDIVAGNYADGDLSYLEGNGDGTFNSSIEYPMGTNSNPIDIFADDFDNNGNLDLVVASDGQNWFFYFNGSGDGTFVNTGNYSAGSRQQGIVADDFDKDGNLDVVVSCNSDDMIAYFQGYGNGTFNTSVGYGPVGYPFPIISGDFDNDTNPDVITAAVGGGGPETFYYIAGNGNGTFEYPAAYPTYDNSYDVYAGDFDNDGDLDIVQPGYYSNNFSYFPGVGDGSFGTEVEYRTGVEPWAIGGGDFDYDQNLDVIVTNSDSDSFSYFKGNGDGTFENTANYSTGAFPMGMTTGDFDNDGVLDLVITSINDNDFSYFRNNYSQSYSTNPALDIGLDLDSEWSYSGEFNVSEIFYGTGFVNELNGILTSCTCPGCSISGGGVNCTIALNFSSGTKGILYLSDLDIEYEVPQ